MKLGQMTRKKMGIRRLFLEGMMFGRLSVLDYAGNASYRCICSCGKEVFVSSGALNRGATNSCGCLRAELIGNNRASHRLSDTKEHYVWREMRQRCTNPANHKYNTYGGRGITVCERWSDFRLFMQDMGPKPGPDYSIDRIDNNKGYSPENCRWATRSEQQRNTSKNRMLTCHGETKSLADWAEQSGIPYKKLQDRVGKLGWSAERALGTP